MPAIRPSSDLRNNYGEISDFCHRYDEPVYITKNGTGDLAVLSIEAYERLVGKFELYALLEKEQTGIKNLKISYNKVFGYYIEVTKSNLKMVPDRYVRKQTLTNGERYITEELKEIESTILRFTREAS